MRVFVTGATGFVGSAVVRELIRSGHQVLGLARSAEGAKSLVAAGAEVHQGDLQDLESLRKGAAAADAVIHTGFIHDFTKFKESCELDRQVIDAIGSVLLGTEKPFIVTSGIGVLSTGPKVATEGDMPDPKGFNPRIASEQAVDAVAAKGVRVAVVRLPPTVHDDGDHGFVPMLIGIAKQKGLSAYKGEGQNRWPAVHRLDAAKLYRMTLDRPFVPGTRFHAVAEEGIAFKVIAEAIGKGLHVPIEGRAGEAANEHFGWFAHFAGLDCPAKADQTKQQLGWKPVEKELLKDLAEGTYFKG